MTSEQPREFEQSCDTKNVVASPAGEISLEESSVTHGAEDTEIAGTASPAVQENYVQTAGQPDPAPNEDLEELGISGGFVVPLSFEISQRLQNEAGEPLTNIASNADQDVYSLAKCV